MPIVAKISQEFGLVGNSEESIRSVMSKNKFRLLQKNAGLFSPQSFELTDISKVWEVIDKMRYPIIIKPAQCSGSRGSKRIDFFDKDNIISTCKDCFGYTSNGKIIVEEFVGMPSNTTIEGDVFIYKGKILYDGIFSTTRASWAPMVPMTYTAPAVLEESQLKKFHSAVEKLLKIANISHGEYNIEGYFTENGDCFIIEINVRQGGHEIPLLIKDFTGIDYTKLLVSTAVGDDTYWEEIIKKTPNYQYVIKQTTFSQYSGTYNGLEIKPELQDYVYRTKEYKQIGDHIDKCVNGQSLVAIVDMIFPNRDKQLSVYDRVNELIKVQTI